MATHNSETWDLVLGLFPFAFVLDGEGQMESMGPRMEALTGLRVGQLLSDGLAQVSPLRPFTVQEARRRNGMLITLATSKNLRFRGQFVPWGKDGVLFVGGPRVTSMNDVSRHGLRLSDFPPHDPNLDLLVLVATKETALKDARRLTKMIERSLREKETLLKEIHHRVKNNLQIIASLLNLQASNAEEGTRELWQESVHRVRSMALVHEHLYGGTSHEHLDLAVYLKRLIYSVQAASVPRRFALELEEVPVTLDVATPIGLVANELVTNAIKHGQSVEGDDWEVSVRLGLYDAGFRLVVETRGPPLDRPLEELARGGTLGMRLVIALTRQLRGQVRVDGCAIVVEIPQEPQSTTSDDVSDQSTRGASPARGRSGDERHQ